MTPLEELTTDDQGVSRVDRTKEIVHPEKVGEPKIVKICENYGKGLIFERIWTLREKNYPDANGYIIGKFENVAREEYHTAQVQAAQVQFYKY
ncbi:MAG: hypothetical protein AABW63_02135 [Nanoarchaeota archaeon]